MSNLLSFGNKLLEIENGKEIYLECGEKLSNEAIDCLTNGDKLFIHDNVYPHGRSLNNEPIHIAIVGPGAVGKSAITQRIIDNTFVADYDPTIEDLFETSMCIDGYNCSVCLLDTAGQEDFKGLREGQMRDKNGYILVYSLVNRDTFEDLNSFYDTLLDVLDSEHSEMKPMILCGNKADLPQHRFDVTENERNERQRQWLANNQYLTSALTGHNIRNMIGWLVRECINEMYPNEKNDENEDDARCGCLKNKTNCCSNCIIM